MKQKYLFFKAFAFILLMTFSNTFNGNAQSLIHSYDFETDGQILDGTGSANGTLQNGATVTGGSLVLNAAGEYAALDAATINISNYTSVTVEVYLKAYTTTFGGNGNASLFYFGNTVDVWKGYDYFYIQGTTGNSNGVAAISTVGTGTPWDFENKVGGPALNDGDVHHIVLVLNETEMTYYADGVSLGTVAYTGSNLLSSVSTTLAWIGKSGYQNDPTFQARIDAFNIYNGEMGSSTVTTNANTYIFSNSLLENITLSAGVLNATFDPSTLTYSATLPTGTTSVTPTATKHYSGQSVTGDGAVDVSSGSGTSSIQVESSDGNSTTTYTINYTVTSASSDATLSDLTVGGVTVDGFDSSTMTYYNSLSDGASSIPTISATATDANVTSVITTQATSVGGKATVVVTAEDGLTTQTYTVLFNSKLHSYTFDSDLTDQIGDDDGIYQGTASVSNGALVLDANGDYISFDGTGLDLNAYEAISMEYYFQGSAAANTGWNWSSYFGDAGGANNLRTSLGHWNDEIRAVYTGYEILLDGQDVNDGNLHQIVTVLTKDSLIYYEDGTRRAGIATGGSFTIGSDYAYLGDGYWSDPTWQGSIHEFNIYNGKLDPSSIAAKNAAFKADQSITFGAISNKNVLDDPFDLTATASSGLTVTYTSSNELVATVSGSTVTIVGEGSTNITASQAGNDDFNAATNVIQPLTVVSASTDATLSSINISAGNLMPVFDSGTTDYVVSLPSGTTSVDVDATRNDATASFTINESVGLDGIAETIAVSGGLASATIEVTAEDGTTVMTYTVNFKEECYTPTFSSLTNLVDDPTISDLANFGGWEWTSGARNFNMDPDYTYCGATSGSVSAVASGTASLDYVLNSKVTAGNTYLSLAKVYATSGVFNFGAYNMDAPSYETTTTTTGTWESMELLFTVGSGVNTGSCGLYFNNYSKDGTGGYIDNWECYDVTEATLTSISGSGYSIDNFNPSQLTYDFQVPMGTSVPTMVVTKADESASVSITQATSLPGTATIVVTGPNGPELTYTVNISEYVITSNDAIAETSIKVYPTVSNRGEFNVATNAASTITVYDLSGKLVQQQNSSSTLQTITLEKSGMYIMKVASEGEVKTFKVFKTK